MVYILYHNVCTIYYICVVAGVNRIRSSGSLQSYLEELTTIGPLGTVISMPTSATACQLVGATFTIEFVQNFGDLPLLVPGTTGLTSVSGVPSVRVSQLIQGTKEDSVCSNRGICDTTTGICTCSNDFSTSNGYNQPGPRGDCGYATTTIQYCPGTVYMYGVYVYIIRVCALLCIVYM